MSCLHDACKSIACCCLWIFRHPHTSLLIDSMNACRMTHASHSMQLGHLLLSSCLTHRRLPVARMSELPCTAINRVYTLPPGGESRGRLHGTTGWVSCQQLRQCVCRGLGRCAGARGLELQDALTKRLEGGDLGFDTGEGLRQLCFQQDAARLAGTLKIAPDEGSDLFEGQPEGAQALDHLHTPDRFFTKQTVVALTPA